MRIGHKPHKAESFMKLIAESNEYSRLKNAIKQDKSLEARDCIDLISARVNEFVINCCGRIFYNNTKHNLYISERNSPLEQLIIFSRRGHMESIERQTLEFRDAINRYATQYVPLWYKIVGKI